MTSQAWVETCIEATKAAPSFRAFQHELEA